MKSCIHAAKQFEKLEKRLDVVVANAALSVMPQTLTKDGLEIQFGTNPQMTIDPTVDVESASSEVLNFDCIFRATYPKKGQFEPSGKRRTKGAVVYECLLCSSDQAWSNPKRDNAIYHAKRKHRDIVNSSDNTVLERSSDMGPPLKQARLDNYYTATPSESALRNVFNPQRYTESMQINWDPKRHRIRCILHVINLSLQAFLFASSREALQAALDAASDITGDELYEPFNFILKDASSGDTTNQPDHMEAQTEHPGGVGCKRTSIQKTDIISAILLSRYHIRIASLLFTRALHKHLQESGQGNIFVNCLNPGTIGTSATTDSAAIPPWIAFLTSSVVRMTSIPGLDGARTTLLLTTDPEIASRKLSGRYFDVGPLSGKFWYGYSWDATEAKLSEAARDDELGEALWKWSIDMMKTAFDKSPDRKMTQQRAKRLSNFRSDDSHMSSAKASKFRSFKNESSLTSYFRITKQLLAYYYRVVYCEDGHFIRGGENHVVPQDIIETTPLQRQAMEDVIKSILLGTPIATSTRAGTPITSRPGPSIASQEGVRLGTPIESPVSSPSIWPRPARERHSRPPVQLQQSAIERPVMERRDFELPDPDWMRDLSHCPLSDRDKELLEKFWTELENDRMEHCARCQETWFDMGLKGGICKRCIARDKNKKEDEPWFFSAENQLDFGLIPAFLPQLTIVEEMLIARVHVFVNVMQVRGQQYKYRGHIVHFLRDVGKVYSQLPLLPPELDVILLRPPTASEHAHLNRQFRRQFRVRRRCLQEWLNFLSNNHPGYRGITVCQKRMSVLPEDGDVLDQVATAAVTDPLSANLGNIENDDVEPDEVDQSAVPDLLPEDTEMEALRSHVLGEERGEHLPVRPSTQHQLEMPDIRRTPINEFNHSQALLSLAFPTLFPRGQAEFVEPRLRPIKYADYIQHALRWHDGRFARHPTFRFVVFNTLMRAQARAKSSYFVKQHHQRRGPITRDDLLEAFQNPESADAQQLLNSINRQTAQLRGTRPYWYRKRRELESYAYNLDSPGAFITFTPADLHWRSLYQHLPQFQDWQELPEQQRMGMSSKLLRDNPHIAAWHFYRYEWQGRGSSHCHGLFWMDGAPSVDLENEHTRKEFVRIWGSHVTALNPEPARVQQQGEGNPLAVNPLRHPLTFQWLSQILNRCQRHHCSETYCLRKKKDLGEISCRFFFPRGTRDTADVVRRQGQSYFSFEATRNDSLMNHYNRCLSLGWLANIDISPCTSLQAVINYAAKYCSKMEKRTDSYASLGRQILPYVSHHNPLLSFASRLMNKLLAERDFSGQEICHVLLNCELQEGTRVVRAVDCRPYEQQGRSLRLEGDHDDAEVVGIYDKYLSRPPLHEELTYLDFLANWNTSKRDGTKWTRWGRQAKPRVLYYFPRYSSNRQHDQCDDFCRVKLMLAHPHRDPNQLRKVNGVEYASYALAAEFCYGNHQHPDDYYGTPNTDERRPDPDQFEREFHEPDLVEEDWLELARQLPDCPPSQEAIDLLGRRDIDIQYDWTPHVGRYADPGIVQGDYWRQRIEQDRLDMDVEDLPLEVRDTLNPEQRIVYDTFVGHFQCGSEEQILLHVDGGGGTGKSYMIKVLSSHLQRLAGDRPSPIWRAAPTGIASNQIMGTTLHSLLRLPVDRAFTELSPADANAIQKKLRDVRYLVIDEKSMLGLRQLSWVDKRLRQVFPGRAADFFGGMSIILVGDFFQLPPVANKPLYFDGPLKDLHEVSGQAAYRAFNHTVFLKKVERQQGDDQAGFRLALEELRGLRLSIESWKLLSQRVQAKLSQCEVDKFDTTLRIYSKKARVNEYNYDHLVRLKQPAIQVMAKNIGNGADKATSEQAGNLAGQFPVCIGARLMITQNIWQPAGLVNGAQGIGYDIGWAPGADTHRDPPCVIMMARGSTHTPREARLLSWDVRVYTEAVPTYSIHRDTSFGLYYALPTSGEGVTIFYISLICQTVGSRPFRSAILSFCAMLSRTKALTRRVDNEQHKRCTWREPGNFNSNLSALTWTAQLILFDFVCFQKQDDEDGIPDLLDQICKKYFQQMAETPFGHVLQWRLYLFAASRTSLAKHQARWSLDGETVDYMGTKLHMKQVTQLVESEFRQAHSLLYDELLFGMRDVAPIEAWRLHDDLDVDHYGASWLTDERNREILAGTHDALLRQIEGRADLRQVFVRPDPNGGVRLCPKAIAIYEAHVQEFLKRILTPISVPSGPPLRSPELLSITCINTGARRRSVFLWEKMVMIYVRYSKSQEQTGEEKDNIRFLPPAVGNLLLTYLAFVLPLRQAFLHLSKPGALLSPYLWSKLGGEVWSDGMVSSCLPRACVRAEVPQFQVAWWRQVAASITKEKFSAREQANFDMGEIAASEEVEDEADLAYLAGMSNHTFRTFNYSYAGSTNLTVTSSLHRAYRASQSWRSLFRIIKALV
ncbi:hypothetical protein FOFC_18358 [Fusarium oxysporum]|nr:hypothetical protein FOFC_18358 [Fusarium oxysporum]